MRAPRRFASACKALLVGLAVLAGVDQVVAQPAASILTLSNGRKIISSAGSPEGVFTAPIGSVYTNTSGGDCTTFYAKESGAGNTGWIAYCASGGGGGGTPGGASGDWQYNNAGAFDGFTPGASVQTFVVTPSSANLAAAVTDETGSGALVFGTSPSFTTPNLGTPSAVTLTNGTGLPVSTGISGLGTGVATFLATPSSANLAAALTDESGSGAALFGTSPTITTPTISGAIVFPDGVRQTFNPDATTPGFNVGAHTADPSTPSNGDCWYNSTDNEYKCRINGASVVMGPAGAATGYATIADEGSGLTQRTTVNFTGAGVSCVDNAGATRTDCTITSGSGTPGGASGDWQYNNAGAFGGFTPGTGVQTFVTTPTSANLAAALTDETGSGAAVFATSPALTTPDLGTPSAVTLTNGTGLPIATGVSGLGTGVATFLATPSSANLAAAVTNETGSGALVFATSPALVTPDLGTPSAATLTNATGLPVSTGISGLGTGVATALATPSSANVAAAVTDETGSGALVFGTSPTLTTPTVSGAVDFPDGTRQTFNPNGTTPGFNVGSHTADPSAPSDGDCWYNSTDAALKCRINGATVELGAAGGGGSGAITRAFGITIDGGGSTITTGLKGFVPVTYTGTITRVTVLSTDASVTSGSIVVDIWKDTYANFAPTDADSITASAPPTITTATKSQDATLTGWTTSVTAGDIVAFNVDSVTSFTRVTLLVEVEETVAGVQESEFDAGNSGTSLAIDWSDAKQQIVTLTGNVTFTFSNPTVGTSYRLLLVQDGTGGRSVTWPASVKWENDTAPTLNTTASKVALCSFVYTAIGADGYLGFCTTNPISQP